MKTKQMFIAISLVSVILLSSCQEQQVTAPSPYSDNDEVNRAILDTYSDLAIQNAIIAQHTIYPYHFVANGVDLNALGQRDLSVLTEHYKHNPGEITVQQGDVDELLYQGRAQMIYEKLLEGGIPPEKINMTDGLPGGEGMPSNSVIEILEKPSMSTIDSSTGSGSGMTTQY